MPVYTQPWLMVLTLVEGAMQEKRQAVDETFLLHLLTRGTPFHPFFEATDGEEWKLIELYKLRASELDSRYHLLEQYRRIAMIAVEMNLATGKRGYGDFVVQGHILWHEVSYKKLSDVFDEDFLQQNGWGDKTYGSLDRAELEAVHRYLTDIAKDEDGDEPCKYCDGYQISDLAFVIQKYLHSTSTEQVLFSIDGIAQSIIDEDLSFLPHAYLGVIWTPQLEERKLVDELGSLDIVAQGQETWCGQTYVVLLPDPKFKEIVPWVIVLDPTGFSVESPLETAFFHYIDDPFLALSSKASKRSSFAKLLADGKRIKKDLEEGAKHLLDYPLLKQEADKAEAIRDGINALLEP